MVLPGTVVILRDEKLPDKDSRRYFDMTQFGGVYPERRRKTQDRF